ncbi:hypothetical protein SPRG_16993 [Saprolegnia parasitica CBS 223.65]|uniref:General transcription and DNA repair factor IIH subunit TFB5 n=1 Tax=Saprolegnia parasitica (strain CBS 223.65) TaxID=695850 RepID=A0A067BT76_SAPPC|nr:hypothetical protein SPRG_16993 [Saprolegnia parasitica CBS 223.65]KDO17496.1 hypothetical protein SPRG_16993 [Saprolegnia parasitica CBS 223.65]|eukprot:XP_012211801.1 hypothetical protein SPRG_16993 [Saprolegnia parasitica CBS 223.65]
MRRSGVDASAGVLVKCDPPTKQYLKHLNAAPGQKKFIIQDLDDTHLFIDPSPVVIEFIKKKIDEWNDANTCQPPTN